MKDFNATTLKNAVPMLNNLKAKRVKTNKYKSKKTVKFYGIRNTMSNLNVDDIKNTVASTFNVDVDKVIVTKQSIISRINKKPLELSIDIMY